MLLMNPNPRPCRTSLLEKTVLKIILPLVASQQNKSALLMLGQISAVSFSTKQPSNVGPSAQTAGQSTKTTYSYFQISSSSKRGDRGGQVRVHFGPLVSYLREPEKGASQRKFIWIKGKNMFSLQSQWHVCRIFWTAPPPSSAKRRSNSASSPLTHMKSSGSLGLRVRTRVVRMTWHISRGNSKKLELLILQKSLSRIRSSSRAGRRPFSKLVRSMRSLIGKLLEVLKSSTIISEPQIVGTKDSLEKTLNFCWPATNWARTHTALSSLCGYGAQSTNQQKMDLSYMQAIADLRSRIIFDSFSTNIQQKIEIVF